MKILGIESSCDETAIAVISVDGETISVEKNLLASQASLHAKYGGVVPEVAAREHVDAIFPLLRASEIPHDGQGIDVIAVTVGPGLVPALRVGVELGKTLAWAWQKPLVAVNHLEGHIYSILLSGSQPIFPALALIVSGGHTEFVLMGDHGAYRWLGGTRDDAAGEAFDKVAKLLGLAYPGGPSIARSALHGDPSAIHFPRPMLESPDLDFSFSGLKTAVLYYLNEHREASVPDVAASFQEAVVDTLTHKTLKAIKQINAKSVILVGGVAANILLRERMSQTMLDRFPNVRLHVPEFCYAGDNAVMM